MKPSLPSCLIAILLPLLLSSSALATQYKWSCATPICKAIITLDTDQHYVTDQCGDNEVGGPVAFRTIPGMSSVSYATILPDSTGAMSASYESIRLFITAGSLNFDRSLIPFVDYTTAAKNCVPLNQLSRLETRKRNRAVAGH